MSAARSEAIRRLEVAASIGAERASQALSTWLRGHARVDVCAVELLTLDRVGAAMLEETTVAIATRIGDGIGGCAAILFTLEQALALASALDAPSPAADGMRSMLEETGNIVICAFLNGLAACFASEGLPCPPAVAIDMEGAAWASLLQGAGASDEVVLVKVRIACAQRGVSTNLVFVPDAGCMAGIRGPIDDGHR